MRIRSLAEKIVLYFVTIGIIAIAVVSTYSFYTSKNALLDRTFEQLTSVRVVKKGQIEQFFNDRLSEMLLVLNSDNLPVGKNWVELNSPVDCFILKHLKSSQYYKAIYFINNDSFGICYNLETSDQLMARTIKSSEISTIHALDTMLGEEPVLHDYIFDTIENRPRMFLTGLYITDDGVKMKIALEVSLEAINRIMLEKNPADGMGLSGESYLVGNDRLMRSTSRFQSESILKTTVETRGVKNAVTGKVGTSVIDDYRGVQVLSSYSGLNITGLNWVILTEIDYEEATRSIYWIRNNIFIITTLVAAVVFIISLIFSKRITLPLIKLNDAAIHIQQGELDVSLPKTKNDEIGQLTHSFDEMAHSLKSKDTELQNERNKRITAMIDGQELERQRLSRELHDGLGQSLIALKLKLSGSDDKSLESIQETVAQTSMAIDDRINEIRRISNDLMPAVLLEFGLVTAIKNICNNLADNSNININFSHQGELNNLGQRMTIYIFRIIQEALNNMVKHSAAAQAAVLIERAGQKIHINIQDNGKGIRIIEHITMGGSGIPNMRERVRLLKGSIDITSQEGKGTNLRINIPITDLNDG